MIEVSGEMLGTVGAPRVLRDLEREDGGDSVRKRTVVGERSVRNSP